MSRKVYVHCADCSETHDFTEANWKDDLMRDLVNNAAAIGALSAVFNDVGGLTLSTDYNGNIDVHWFAKHAAHRLCVIDEYGVIGDNCRLLARCSSCATSHRCALKHGHEGPCVPAKAR